MSSFDRFLNLEADSENGEFSRCIFFAGAFQDHSPIFDEADFASLTVAPEFLDRSSRNFSYSILRGGSLHDTKSQSPDTTSRTLNGRNLGQIA
ncbi:hypothetical protein [Leisingera daeponensis]|uniref:hypothetical protein n=1 Tax=Leisingera daeponensis TaxID=405746 RepID=UPI001C9598A7|nr:hypothetical protein [Leisingera daeponensis]MBY6059735.1 hypothetical protein [Leisingera daeponensis]